MENGKRLSRSSRHYICGNKSAYIVLFECLVFWLTPVENIKYGAIAWMLERAAYPIIYPVIPLPHVVPIALFSWFLGNWYLFSSYLMIRILFPIVLSDRYSRNDSVGIMLIMQIGAVFSMKFY